MCTAVHMWLDCVDMHRELILVSRNVCWNLVMLCYHYSSQDFVINVRTFIHMWCQVTHVYMV